MEIDYSIILKKLSFIRQCQFPLEEVDDRDQKCGQKLYEDHYSKEIFIETKKEILIIYRGE